MSVAALPLQRPETEAAQEESKSWSRGEAAPLPFPSWEPQDGVQKGDGGDLVTGRWRG